MRRTFCKPILNKLSAIIKTRARKLTGQRSENGYTKKINKIMASEFDNEMDFLLRRAAQQNDLASDQAGGKTAHLDADDLSAFAENALPQQLRLDVISHLADCNSCRQILSNLILLNEDAQAETDLVAEPQQSVVVVKPSWLDSFKKLFALPAFGYATATLAILLVSVFAFVALRGRQENNAVSLARVEPDEQIEVQEATKRQTVHAPAAARDEESEPKPAEEVPAETPNINPDQVAESTPTPSESEVDENLPPFYKDTKRINQNNSVSANVPARREASAANSSNSSSTSNTSVAASLQSQPAPPAAGTVASKPATPPGSEIAGAAVPKPIDRAKAELGRRASELDQSAADDKNDALESTSPERAKPAASSSVYNELKTKKVVVETRVVGGKTFQKVGAVWQDADYKSQNVTNVLRNSDDYKKLDSGLLSIAQNLGGEIIVVWQGKAYRIR